MIKGMFQQSNYFSQLLITIGVFVIMNIVSSFLAIIMAIPMFNLGMNDVEIIFTNLTDPRYIAIIKMIQIIVSLFSFVITALLLGYLFSDNKQNYLSLDKKPRVILLFLAVILLIVLAPFINYLGALNSNFHFPHFMQGIEQYLMDKSKQNLDLMEALLKDVHPGGIIVNVLMIAILPAIGEELFFRGVIQNIFHRMTRNHHWGIWISAIIFSLIHMEFTGFIPRMVLGALFGYLLVWSGSIWIPILAHFINNVTAVILYYFINTGQIGKESVEFGSTPEVWPYILLSTALSGIIIWYFYRYTKQEKTI